MKAKIKILSILSVAVLFAACSETERVDVDSFSESDLIEMGKEVFYLNSAHNNISCADCHSDGTNDDNLLTKYFSDIRGANKRESTYLGQFTGEQVEANAGGATVCWNHYMLYKTPLSDVQIKALNAYFNSLITSNEDLAPRVYETIALPERDKRALRLEQEKVMQLTGDVDRGKEIFAEACILCHSPDSKVSKVPSLKEDFEGNIKGVVFMTRLGDGAMPFYSFDKLSDQQIADLSAYVMSLKD